MNLFVRKASDEDLESILAIYNQGIVDRIATLETEVKAYTYIRKWFDEHQGRYTVLVAEVDNTIIGWASLNRYSNRCAYDGVADLSIYIERDYRGKGVGKVLLRKLEETARSHQFYKIVLFTFPFNELGQGLYKKCGYREVGVFHNQGILDGSFVDVMAMEKVLIGGKESNEGK
ncbi:arsinothricin resistance N-acetyltransferase ArsN1 family A [Brevibacillus brevis]|uniref:arsinothricin resistance N-acetyltransferase ArsN1 family A n=1 Tax=Brevibacillus brevis TaxID=1393 RepID=UPI000D0ED0BD|nr:arsinothricin resistance N-acetyltransferase ArsN1 family A [Brevibacillus brevis]PSJ68219.1 GNAT family N-acetyltransferase [Brevibacillus brevis]RED35725.1 phosphinothricin acetyltransferase [Brevibacillus brevis]GEC89268.1 N-acetyltransferase [Brevibacillus brevis]VEF89164.1 Putative phosphinothricin acetyltransferase YwnH [Brevibacillus brevis]